MANIGATLANISSVKAMSMTAWRSLFQRLKTRGSSVGVTTGAFARAGAAGGGGSSSHASIVACGRRSSDATASTLLPSPISASALART